MIKRLGMGSDCYAFHYSSNLLSINCLKDLAHQTFGWIQILGSIGFHQATRLIMCNLYIQWKKWSFVLSAFDFIYGFDILIDRIYMTLETMCCSRNVIKECNMMVKESISVMACTLFFINQLGSTMLIKWVWKVH